MVYLSAPEPLGSRRRLAGLIAAASLIVGCGGGAEILVEQPLQPRPAPQGIVILPVAVLTPGADGLSSMARTRDVADWLLDHTELPLIGPFDYKSYKEPDEMQIASVDTDLMTPGAQIKGVDLRNWLAIHLMITENRATNIRDIVDKRAKDPKKRKTFRQYGIDSTLRVEAQVLDARYGKRLAQVVLKAKDDPTKVRSEGDPRPVLRDLIRQALGLLLAETEAIVAAKNTRRVRSAGFLDAVPALADWKTQLRKSFFQAQEGKDDIEKQAALESLWIRFQPGLPVKATFVGTRHPGVMALEARPPLEQYDVIKLVDGKKLVAVYQLDRILQGCKGGCMARIRRGFKDLDVRLAWPPLQPPEEDD